MNSLRTKLTVVANQFSFWPFWIFSCFIAGRTCSENWSMNCQKVKTGVSCLKFFCELIWSIKKLETFQSSKLEELTTENLQFCEPIPSKITWILCNFCKAIVLWNGFWNFERTQTMINVKSFKVPRLKWLVWKKLWDIGTNSVFAKTWKN